MSSKWAWVGLFLAAFGANAGEDLETKLIFPLQAKHVHSSCVIECPNGDLLCTWFHGSGERRSMDVTIEGARLRKGAEAWSEVFPMADTPNPMSRSRRIAAASASCAAAYRR